MLDIAGQTVSILQLAALGLCVGYTAGLFGVGGGFMLTPMLNLVFGIPFPIAVGSGLCQMIGTAASAYRKHRRLGSGDFKFGVIILGGSIFGVDAGTRLLASLNRMGALTIFDHSIPAAKFILEVLFALLLISIGFQFIHRNIRRKPLLARHLPSKPGLPPPLLRLRIPPLINFPDAGIHRASLPLIVYLGFSLGILSGLMGVGGGVVLIPVLVYGLGFSFPMAVGTGLLPLVIVASIGTVSHAFHGHIHLGLVVSLMIGSTLGAQFGAITAHRIRSERLWTPFVGVILLTASALVFDIARMFTG